MSTTFVLGAGFSCCSGLPVQAEFSDLLLGSDFSSEIDIAITAVLKRFFADVFGWSEGNPLPALEDIFTCIDLSAGAGHHLAIKYTPKALRAIRRMMIYRVFSVLDVRFSESPDILKLLRHAFSVPGSSKPAFVVLNWDIVLEKHLADFNHGLPVDYCCDAANWHDVTQVIDSSHAVQICKMHGSSNWVYCENCSAIFYDLDQKLSLHSKVGLIKSDFRLFDEKFGRSRFNKSLGVSSDERKCRYCKNMISSHIATFSYRKSFRTHAYQAVWHQAAKMLSTSSRWVFIGYSLPKADFELKHLLKSAQLRFLHKHPARPIKMDVVVKGDASKAEYEGFFGVGKFRYFSGGLEDYVAKLPKVSKP